MRPRWPIAAAGLHAALALAALVAAFSAPARAWPAAFTLLVGTTPGSFGSEGVLRSLPGGPVSLEFRFALTTGPAPGRPALESHLVVGGPGEGLRLLGGLTLVGGRGFGLHVGPAAGVGLQLGSPAVRAEALWTAGVAPGQPSVRLAWEVDLGEERWVELGFRQFAGGVWSGWFAGYAFRD